MKLVYVRHFLNKEGIEYFSYSWFPRVNEAISTQYGFISIASSTDKNNPTCINIILKFKDDATLQAWVNTKIHGELIDLLDPYRVSDWLWAAVEIHNENDLHDITWNTAVPKTVVY